MKKFLPLLLLSVFFILPQSAYAGLSEGCFPIVTCDPGQDFYAGACNTHIETLASCPAPGAGKYSAFSCDSGCYVVTISVPGPAPTCPGGVELEGVCLRKLNLVDDTPDAFTVGNKAYKIWDGAKLTEILHVGSAGCTNGQMAVSDSTSETGWKCANPAADLWVLNVNDIYWNTGGVGNVGIGTTTPNAKLNVELPATGGPAATIGRSNSAAGSFSVAMGESSKADGWVSMALGQRSEATAQNSTAMGYYTTASGPYSTSMGANTVADGNTSTAMGSSTVANGQSSTAMGLFTTADAQAVTVIGRYNVGGGSAASWVLTDPLFEIGNGASAGAPANAFTVLKNGNVGIGTATPTSTLQVNGTITSTTLCLGGECTTEMPSGEATWAGVTDAPGLDGARGGYASADAVCNSKYAGSRVCSMEDILQLNRQSVLPSTAGLKAWVNGGAPGYNAAANDCGGWKLNANTAANTWGRVWWFDTQQAWADGCNLTRQFACCK